MKTNEEIKQILNDTGNERRHKLLEMLLSYGFSNEELACILVGTLELCFPINDNEGFKHYCDTIKAQFAETNDELERFYGSDANDSHRDRLHSEQ